MEEVPKPVNLVKSGKTYRQLFDAEVQLMKSLGKSTFNSLKILPQIKKNEESLQYIKTNGGGLTNTSILNDRQLMWINGNYDDSKIENPVMKKKFENEILKKQTMFKIEENEVRGLPNELQITGNLNKDSVSKRIKKTCQQKYDNYLAGMYNQIGDVKNEINPKIRLLCENFKQEFEEVDEKIKSVFKVVAEENTLINKDVTDFEEFWSSITKLLKEKTNLVATLSENMHTVEENRLNLISKVLNKYGNLLKEVTTIPVNETCSLLESESMLLNQTCMANRKVLGKLQRNLKEEIINQEITMKRNLAQIIESWKKLSKDRIVNKFVNFMNSDEVKSPPEAVAINKKYLNEQKEVVAERDSVLKQLLSFQPPVSTKPSVYKWNSTLTKTQQKLENLQKSWIEELQMVYEKCCQNCLDQVEVAKGDLELVADDCSTLINEKFLTRVGNQLKVFEHRIHSMEMELENCAKNSAASLHSLFQFVQSIAHLWDIHEINMARKDREIEVSMEQSRAVFDKQNEEKESSLDVLVDRLRQENTPENLKNCQDLCFHLLSEIKSSYHEFYEDQVEKLQNLPSLVADEAKRYQETVCNFFCVKRKIEAKEEGEESAEAEIDDIDQKESHNSDATPVIEIPTLEYTNLHETLTTPLGTVYEVHSKVDVTRTDETTPRNDEFLGVPSMASMFSNISSTNLKDIKNRDYLENVPIENEMLSDMKKKIRMTFLQYLDDLMDKSLNHAEEKVNYKKEELKCELNLRLQLHQPRSSKIEKDVKTVRQNEIDQHQDRVTRHCKGMNSSLLSYKASFNQQLGEITNKINEYKDVLSKAEEKISKNEQSKKINECLKNIDEEESKLMNLIKEEEQLMKVKMLTNLNVLKKSNKLCINSFKLFSDGGSFSPDEVVVYRKMVDVEAKKVEAFAAEFQREFGSGIEKRIHEVNDVTHKFREKMKFHLVDVEFTELIRSNLLTCQVNIKSEVQSSNLRLTKLRDDVTMMKQMIDAFEYKHVDKMNVTSTQLWNHCVSTVASITSATGYFDCHINETSIPGNTDDQSYQVKDSNALTGNSSVQGVESKQRSAGQIIKSILKKQNKEDANQNVAVQKSRKVYCEIPAPSRKSTAETQRVIRKSVNRKTSAHSAMTNRRDTRLDPKFFPYGIERPQKEHFLARISAVLFDVLENLYKASDDYYKHRGFRQSTRTHIIKENFDSCCEAILEKSLIFYDQCQDFYYKSLSDFRFLVEEFELVSQHVPRVLLEDISKSYDEQLTYEIEQAEEKFYRTVAMLEKEKDMYEKKLEPVIGHPKNKKKLDQLTKAEGNRQLRHNSLIEQSHSEIISLIQIKTRKFYDDLITNSSFYLKFFQKLICIDDLTRPDKPVEIRKPLSKLLKMRMKDPESNINKFNIVDYDIKSLGVPRGPAKWEPLKFPENMFNSSEICKPAIKLPSDIHVNITEDVSVSQSTQNNQVLEKGESHLKISQSKNLVADSTTAVSGETKSAKVEEESVQLQKDKITTNLLSTIEQEISEEEVLFEVLPLETSNSVLPQHQTVRSRDVIFDRCLQSRVETLQLKSNQRNERFKTEERWKNSWVKTLEDICSFYE